MSQKFIKNNNSKLEPPPIPKGELLLFMKFYLMMCDN